MDEDVLEGIVRRVYERIGDVNYVKLKALIRRFLEYNPGVDVETIDWLSHYDDGLEFEELVEAFRNAYPMYRWDRPVEMSLEQYEDEKVGWILENIEDLSEEAIRRLIRELESRVRAEAEVGEAGGGEALAEAVEEAKTVSEAVTAKPVKAESVEEPRKIVINLALLARYPFLEEVRGFVRAYDMYEVSAMPRVVDRARGRIVEALERGELGVIPRLEDLFTELLSFPVAKAIVATIGDDWLKRRWSLAEAARIERLLYSEPRNVFEYLVVERLKIAQRCDNTDEWVRLGFGDREYRVRVADYLRVAGDLLNNPEWKLVNQVVWRGYVYLSRARLTRIVRQYLYTSLYRTFETTPRLDRYPEVFAEAVGDVAARLREARAGWRKVRPSGRTPPCIVAIRERLADAGHSELFTYASYLLNKGYTVDQVVDELRVRTDFNEKIARYQVEHIAGLRGSRIKYRPPSCSTMKSLGLCIRDGELCPRNIRNPLDF